MQRPILVLNAGSSSIKFQLFDPESLERRMKGQLDGIGTHPAMLASDASGASLTDRRWTAAEVGDLPAALALVLAWLERQLPQGLAAAGHRVVHGGPDFAAPTLVDAALLQRLRQLEPLAPLHQPHNLAAIRALAERHPSLPQVACFDTAFHRGHRAVAERFAIPEALYQEGVRRYGFHGLSYEYIASVLPSVAPEIAHGRVVVAHLGAGCSLCALQDGRSVDSTMGFTALDGLPMATRSGQIDPGVLLYLLEAKGWTAQELQHFLYHECGLKGLSAFSGDLRDLLVSDAPSARLAVDYFVYRVVREIGSLAAALGGLDGLAFTAGIGEHAAPVRGLVCEALSWLGVDHDPVANVAGGPRLTRAGSPVSAWMIPTDEELMVARHTRRLCA